MDTNYKLRLVNTNDSLQCIKVYEPYVLYTSITFDYEVPTVEEFSTKIADISTHYPWIVCLDGEKVIGYAYASKLRFKAAYLWTTESTIYIDSAYHGKGIGKILYKALFELLTVLGYYNVYAGVLVPNESSEHFHRKQGFYDVGTYKKIGFKLGKWHDVMWLQYHLNEHPLNPEIPKSIKDINMQESINRILDDNCALLNKKPGSN